jgi:hypothetical protein
VDFVLPIGRLLLLEARASRTVMPGMADGPLRIGALGLVE